MHHPLGAAGPSTDGPALLPAVPWLSTAAAIAARVVLPVVHWASAQPPLASGGH